MGTITVLRPSATSSAVGWSAVPSGTLHGVTSDNSDLTYALWSGSGSAMILPTPADAPPVGERRHQVRMRMRGEDGDVWGAVRLTSGALVAGAAAQFTSSPGTISGAWGFGAPADGSTVLSAYVTGQTSGLKIEELYLDVDSRLAPLFTLSVLDGSGSPSVLISDTAQPTISAGTPDLDDLQPRQYRYWVTLGAAIVWDTGVVSGPSDDRQTAALDNGSYVAHAQVWSTLGSNIAYPSTEHTLAFTLLVGTVPKPDNPTVSPVADSPFYELGVCAPYAGDFDGDQAYVEIQRVDCPATTGQRFNSVAILGPLDTDECATYVDYSLPRTGVGLTCDHQPDPCCSYYRARTVGRVAGQLQISDWSDAYDPGVPNGLIVMWADTVASIPAGWNRVTALDSKYPKGIATTGTQPGTTGGAASHTHTLPTHVHDTSHLHTTSANTSAAVGAFSSADGAVGTTAIAATHTHTTPSTNSATVSSGTATPSVTSGNNDPDRLEVLFIESDGSPLGVPNGALGLAPDISLSGWTDHAAATGRFLRGAGSGADGGTTVASIVASHLHALGAHPHTGLSHSHTSSNTGAVTSNLSMFAGPTSGVWAGSHAHPITIPAATATDLTSGGGANSGTTSLGTNEPPFTNARVKKNTSGGDSLPVGLVGLWRGSLGSIPDHWSLCDGTGGTLDLVAKYPKGATAAIGTTGGSLSPHTHTSPSHNHATTGHAHTMTIGVQNAATANLSTTATVSIANGTHTHTHGSTASTTPTVGNSTSGTLASTTTEPPYEEVAYVQLTSEPTPPPAPDEWCLDWNVSEHLIRTNSPNGPLFAAVGGIFTWDRDRPFTSATGVMGKRFVTSSPPGGRNLHLTTAVSSEAELAQLQAVLARPLVLVSPSDAAEVWAAPVASSVKVIKIGRIRQVTADFIATGPQPGPQLADVGV